ncbi:MAG: sialidase family protein [Bacteroidota bacterium]
MKKLALIFILTIGIMSVDAQNGNYNYQRLIFGENYRIYPSNVTQTEVFIVSSPVDENILFTSCNTLTFIPFFVSEGIYVSENGGNTWQGNDTCTGAPEMFHGGDPGIAIDKNGRFIITRLGRSPFVGLYSHYSNDNGKTWSAQKVISSDDLERAAVTTDAITTSTYYGRTYAAWVKFATPFPIMVSYTDDGAETWSTPMQINSPIDRSAGGDIDVGPNGKLNLCWAGVTETSPFKEVHVGFASSTNGGLNWTVTENAFAVDGITGILPNKGNIRVNGLPGIAVDNSGGDRNGWIYIVTGQKNLAPAGSDPDIILNRSTDGGVTWSSAIRVNQDALNNGKSQYFPTVHIDKFGAVNIIFYDDRNTTIDSTGVFLARSTDGGDTWNEYEISSHNFKPTPIGGLGQGYQGDNIDITSTQTKLWPVWMDNSTGNYQIWTVPIDFSSLDNINTNEVNPSFNRLDQNYPNPFSNSTTIGYNITKTGLVTLKIFDAMGNELQMLVNETQKPGYYNVTFTMDEFASNNSILFYRFKVGDYSKTKSMISLH